MCWGEGPVGGGWCCSAAALGSAGTGSDAAVTPAPPCCRLWNTAVAEPKPKSNSSLCPLLGVCQGSPEPPGSPASKHWKVFSTYQKEMFPPSLLRTQSSRKDRSCFDSTSSKFRNSISFKGTLTCKEKGFLKRYNQIFACYLYLIDFIIHLPLHFYKAKDSSSYLCQKV